ncbi:MAG: hypothetical protein ACR65O_13190 [Methylomicrobium sp.]
MNWIKKFISLSFPIKLIIGSIASVIAGPGVVSFVSEYASYYYALEIGVRPPLEGIPYLSATTALVSFIFALSASIVFISTRWMISRIGGQFVDFVENILPIFSKGLYMVRFYTTAGGKFIKKISASDALNLIKGLSFTNVIFLAVALSLLLICLIEALPLFKNINEATLVIGVTIYVTVTIFTIWSNSFAWVFAGIAVISKNVQLICSLIA